MRKKYIIYGLLLFASSYLMITSELSAQVSTKPLTTAESDSIDSLRMYEARETKSQKMKDKKSLSDLKSERSDTKQQAKDARRVERDANDARKESRIAYRLEKQAQKARAQADKQAKKATKARKISDGN